MHICMCACVCYNLSYSSSLKDFQALFLNGNATGPVSPTTPTSHLNMLFKILFCFLCLQTDLVSNSCGRLALLYFFFNFFLFFSFIPFPHFPHSGNNVNNTIWDSNCAGVKGLSAFYPKYIWTPRSYYHILVFSQEIQINFRPSFRENVFARIYKFL